ncbi:NUDIX domain-containing protein [Clostridioides difficile]|nr:NUDIX domain-containing protein [Clostridioides difficile]
MELWDLYNTDGIKTGKVIERGNSIEEGYYHLAVEVWILNRDSQILIQKRSKSKKTLPNMWGMTTGCIISGEESLEGAIREAKEEIGIDISKDEMKVFRSMIHGDTLWDVYFVKKEYDISKAILQEEEVSDIKWVSTDRIRQLIKDGLFFEYPEIYELLYDIDNNNLNL